MFLHRIRLFRLFGFNVYVDASWLLLAILIVWTLAQGWFPRSTPGQSVTTYIWMGVATAAGLLVSIVLHEMAHALVARRYKMPIRGITLFIFGGVAEMESEPTNARAEFLMAAVGPLTSALFGALLLLVADATSSLAGAAPAVGVLAYLGGLNLVLAIFNLIPAFPLDGGRVLRSALWGLRRDYAWATRIAALSGQAFGILLILFGLWSFISGFVVNGVWIFLIGMFLHGAASLARRQLSTRQALGGEPISRFMTSNPVAVAPDTPIQTFVDDNIYRHHHKAFPVVQDGRLVGCVGVSDIGAVARASWPTATVGEHMKPCTDQTAAKSDDALGAMARMSCLGVSRLFVVEGGKLVGVLSLRDLLDFIALKLDLERAERSRSLEDQQSRGRVRA